MSDPLNQLPQLLKDALGDSYTIEGEIGRGGMGVVYRARDTRLQRRVAVKVLPPQLAFSQEIRERFIREAQTAARLSHPHIVPIHDVGEGEGIVYFVMGLIEGESLAGRIRRRGRVPQEETRRIIKETADALSAAHAISIIHRDIKPDNILLEGARGRVMVTDFGIAKAMSGGSSSTLTSAGMAIGTPSFMSPEQAAGEREIDGRSDLYSLGIVAYQMLAGELPFNAPTVAGILMKQITEPAPLLHEQFPDVGEDLSLAVARCLEKDPANRWPSADGLRRALESRNVSGYRPTGLGWKAEARPTRPSSDPAPRSPRAASRPVTERSPRPGGVNRPSSRPQLSDTRAQRGAVSPRPELRGGLAAREAMREARRNAREARKDAQLPETGEPKVVRSARNQFVSWAGVTAGCFLLNLATGIHEPWFLFPMAGMSFGLFKRYSDLWQAGYSWRDVLNRPNAHDAIIAPGGKRIMPAKTLAAPVQEDLGRYFTPVKNIHGDRTAILSLWSKLTEADRQLLPEMIQTVDGLYERSIQLGQTLHAMDDLREDDTADGELRLKELRERPESAERDRQIDLLERKQRAQADLLKRRSEILDRLESCSLMMQTLRLDALRIKDRGIGAVMNGLNEATQQARAMSRDVDNALGAAQEIKETM